MNRSTSSISMATLLLMSLGCSAINNTGHDICPDTYSNITKLEIFCLGSFDKNPNKAIFEVWHYNGKSWSAGRKLIHAGDIIGGLMDHEGNRQNSQQPNIPSQWIFIGISPSGNDVYIQNLETKEKVTRYIDLDRRSVRTRALAGWHWLSPAKRD